MRQHAEDKVYSALGRLKTLKERRPEMIVGVLGCMAQKDQAQDFPPRVARRSGGRPGAVVPPAGVARRGGRRSAAAVGSEPRAQRGGRASVRGEFRPLRSAADGRGAAGPLPGDGADRPRLRQVLQLLHRAAGARAGAEPPRRGNRGGSPPIGRPGVPGSRRSWARRSTATRTRPVERPSAWPTSWSGWSGSPGCGG